MTSAIPTTITMAPTAHPAGTRQFGVDEFVPAPNKGVAAARQAQQQAQTPVSGDA
jgi:hypothetical protein